MLRIYFPPTYYKRVLCGKHALIPTELRREIESIKKISDYSYEVRTKTEVSTW